jgi:hypothetical protein
MVKIEPPTVPYLSKRFHSESSHTDRDIPSFFPRSISRSVFNYIPAVFCSSHGTGRGYISALLDLAASKIYLVKNRFFFFSRFSPVILKRALTGRDQGGKILNFLP